MALKQLSRSAVGIAAVFFVAMATPAFAQGSSETTVSTGHFSDEDAAAFSKTIERDLAAKGARIAIVFRTGRARDRLPGGINYTHGAFWVHQAFQLPSGEVISGYNTWNLFHGDGENLPTTTSYLSEEMPFTFLMASAVDDVAVIVPTPAMQDRLRAILASETYSQLHDPDYSLISNPADPDFQNCVEFMLDVVSAAAWETTDRIQIKANLSAHFEPTRVKAGLLARTFGPLADPRLKTKDHRGRPIETATYESLSAFMMDHGLADETYLLTFDRNLQADSPA